MTNHTHYIWALCRKLSKQGLTPSVALIRARAEHTLPIPVVIKALNSYKEDPAKVEHELAENASSLVSVSAPAITDSDLASTVIRLEKQIGTMSRTIDTLNARLDRLERAQK